VDRRFLRQLDWPLVIAALTLGVLGIAMVLSATSTPGELRFDYAIRQLIWLFLGVLAAIAAASLPLRAYDGLAPYLYGLSIVLLLLVLVAGTEVFGARRWLGVGAFRFQPSELAKLATLLMLARVLDDKQLDLRRARSWIKPLVVVGIPMVLVLRQPDLSTSLAFVVLLVATLYWAGLSFRLLVLGALPFANAFLMLVTGSFWPSAGLVAVLLAWVRPRAPALVAILAINAAVAVGLPFALESLKPYQRGRIETFLNPGRDPYGAGYQIIQSRIAIGSGGPFGRGYLGGRQKSLQFLPQKHTDFIFSVVGEELGFWGTALALSLYLVVLLRGLWIARAARSHFAGLLAFGISMLLFYHLMVNVLMTVGWAPVTGLPLPLLSYGGTALVVTCIEIGLLANISLRRQEY
jgi:rod shape determining protein RodA